MITLVLPFAIIALGLLYPLVRRAHAFLDLRIAQLAAPGYCSRPAPHLCRVNGPCNGLPVGR